MKRATYQTAFDLYPYQPVAQPSGHHPVVVIGAGPVGLALALDLGRKGISVLVLDEAEGVGAGSRAICFAKRTLEICNRMGLDDALMQKGVQWNVGKVFHGDSTLFEFNLAPEGHNRNPAFINLQQPYFEKFLFDKIQAEIAQGAPIEIRGANRATGLQHSKDTASLTIETPDGTYDLTADYIVACDGARSPTRTMLGLDFDGRVFEDNFLIADVKMTAPFPTERWFWFEPPFKNAGQSALLHKQPDDVWRIDFQLGWDIDRELELQPDRIRARVDAMLGDEIDYSLEWTSIYTFQCRRMAKFRHGRVFFAGDSAHQVSPFGARGANSGVQDADNLAWKLHAVLIGQAPEVLLDSYCTEREAAADENILNSTRATDFLTPKSPVSRVFRDAVLDLAGKHAFARPLVNSGRLSVPFVYDLPNAPDFNGPPVSRPGASCPDASLNDGYVLDRLKGLCILAVNCDAPDNVPVPVITVQVEADSPLAQRYLGSHGQALYLIRPDQHIAARWLETNGAAITAAIDTLLGRT